MPSRGKRLLRTSVVHRLYSSLTFLVVLFANISGGGVPSFSPALLWISSAHAASDTEIPNGWESYYERPDILAIQPQARAASKSWEAMKAAHFSFIAELLVLYSPDTHFYFLARDSELLYDAARLVTEGTAEAERVHLLNVSRANMRDPHMKAYLAENGISEATLAQGKKVVFVDTGFSGTIPRVIVASLPADLKEKFKTHLIVSSNPQHPSSRAFLIHLNPMANEQYTSAMHGTIVSYEYMPRSTDRSQRFVFSGGRYHPISPIGQSADGEVSKEKSRHYMADLKADWQNPETRARFQKERAQVETVKRVMMSDDVHAKDLLLAKLEAQKNTPEGHLLVALIHDVWEAQANAELSVKWTPTDFGLQIGTQGHAFSKKNALIAKFPDWAPVLEDPVTQIPLLFQKQDWQMIGNLIDADVDQEINQILAKFLYDASATGLKREMQISMIENGNQETLHALAQYTFSQPHTSGMTELLRLLIKKADKGTLRSLAWYTFSQPHTKDMTELLRLLIEKADQYTLKVLAHSTFSQPHAQTQRHQILSQALSIMNHVQRKAHIAAEWAKIDPPAGQQAVTEDRRSPPSSAKTH